MGQDLKVAFIFIIIGLAMLVAPFFKSNWGTIRIGGRDPNEPTPLLADEDDDGSMDTGVSGKYPIMFFGLIFLLGGGCMLKSSRKGPRLGEVPTESAAPSGR